MSAHLSPSLFGRSAAFVIDYVGVMLVLQLVATIGFAMTGGLVQTDGPLKVSSCRWPPAQPVSFPYGEPFVSIEGRTIEQRVCTLGLPSLPHARVLVVTASQKSGRWTTNQTDRIAIDKHNRAVWILWLGVFGIPLLWFYRSLTEYRSGQTFGKRLLGLRVAADTGGSELTWQQCSQRNLWLVLPLLFVDLLYGGPMLGIPNLVFLSPALAWPILIVSLSCAVWYLLIIIDVTRRRDPFHDRRSGTSVRRIS